MPRLLLNFPDNARMRRVFLPEDLERLAALGETVRFDPKTGDAAEFPALLREADVMLTGWGSRPLTVADWQAAERGVDRPLFVAHAAGSVRGFIPQELLGQGLRLSQSAVSMAPAVAQFAVGLMILGLRQSVARTLSLKAGEPKNEDAAYRDLRDVTVGLWGLSQVGRRVPPLLHPFGCRILAFDPYCRAEDAAALGVRLVSDLDALARESDVLSLHAPVTDETKGQLDARRIALLASDSVVVNTARAALTDQDALFARAERGEIQVYVDVTTPEPLPPQHKAWQCSNIFITAHQGGATTQVLRSLAAHSIGEIERYLKGEPLETEITSERYSILA